MHNRNVFSRKQTWNRFSFSIIPTVVILVFLLPLNGDNDSYFALLLYHKILFNQLYSGLIGNGERGEIMLFDYINQKICSYYAENKNLRMQLYTL